MHREIVLFVLASLMLGDPVAAQSRFTTCAAERQVLGVPGPAPQLPTVSIQGDRMAIGSWWNGGSPFEEVTLYRSGPTGWTEEARLAPTPAAPNLGFGCKILLSGDTALVAALEDPDWTARLGAVYVFDRSGTGWHQTAKLSGSVLNGFFGVDIDFDGRFLVVGAPHVDGTGGAYVFERQGSGWSLDALLQGQNMPQGSDLGRAVAIDGEWLAIGGPAHGHHSIQSRVLMYRREPTGAWVLHADLHSPGSGDEFGAALALEGRHLVVGAPETGTKRGRVHVYGRLPGSNDWTPLQVLDPPNVPLYPGFGYSLALDRGVLAVGSPEGWGRPGTVYLHARGGSWYELARLRSATAGGPWQQFGSSLALDGSTLAIGAIDGQQVFVYDVGPQCPETFCQAKINSLFCSPTIEADGLASLTTDQRFEITGRDVVPDETGMLLYGTSGRGNLPFHGGKLCVKAPLVRVFPAKSSGHAGPGLCSGVLRTDFNAHIRSGADPALEPGARVVAQWLYRDPPVDAFGDGLTAALEFVVAP